MSAVESLIKDIKNKKFLPIYFLAGEEPFFIDQITEALEANVLTEEEKGFNQTIIYGQDVEMNQVVGIAKQYPMGADKAFVLVKEAQHLSKSIDDLDAYANQIQESTVLVFNYKGKKLDKRTKIYKTLNSKGYYFEFKPLYANEIPTFIDERIKANKQTIDPKAKFLLAEYVGSDLSRLSNELDKLKTIVGISNTITVDDIEKHIGISKEYNNFELRSAIETRNIEKAFKIIKYFEKNPKDNPMVVTMTVIFSLFTNIIQYHILADKSKANVAKEIGINPFFVQDLAVAANNYPLKKATRIVSLIREYDMKGKGVNSSGNVTSSELLVELIYKIINF
ncbi:DNA polymerase III subunit delta [Faecalibacter bovis]|uniref:DNA polymerase III subunit delta n=1 Tax=Faecalibacter bovis TaxID=2898187 RepID=A0ABX7XDG4_9FLAO|nr:DNA polymerase III subunit delta [Faecalibacter bovis]MBS7333992.1 DNA polymerase III subunit delta [Weeksellaceae bacterium]QTV05807.1 DNA polymerase III subunit delta [Faecalibacter bovis]